MWEAWPSYKNVYCACTHTFLLSEFSLLVLPAHCATHLHAQVWLLHPGEGEVRVEGGPGGGLLVHPEEEGGRAGGEAAVVVVKVVEEDDGGRVALVLAADGHAAVRCLLGGGGPVGAGQLQVAALTPEIGLRTSRLLI